MRLFESPGATCSVRSCTGPLRVTLVLLLGSVPQEKRLGVKNCRKGNRTKKELTDFTTKEKGMASCPDPGCSFDDLHRIAALLIQKTHLLKCIGLHQQGEHEIKPNKGFAA